MISISDYGADVGSYAITQGTLAGPTGYLSGTYTGANADITAKAVTITGMAATSRVYNSNDVAALTGGTVAGTVGGETLNFSGQSGQFNNKNVGTVKAVTVTGLALADGTLLASNYSVTQPVGLTADITAKAVTVAYTAANKTFDSTTSANVAGSSADIIGGDNIGFT